MKHRIWEGAVGIALEPRENRQTGNYFWSFEITRCFKPENSDEMRYTPTFSENNVEALGNAISKAIAFMQETDPDEFAASQAAKAA